MNPSATLIFWVDKRGATTPLMSFQHADNGPDTSKFDENTYIVWLYETEKRSTSVSDAMNERA